jgi:hypothetical protein
VRRGGVERTFARVRAVGGLRADEPRDLAAVLPRDLAAVLPAVLPCDRPRAVAVEVAVAVEEEVEVVEVAADGARRGDLGSAYELVERDVGVVRRRASVVVLVRVCARTP